MKLLPYDKFEVTVKLPPWDVCRRLLENVPEKKFFSGLFAESKPFKGNIEEASFKIYRNIWYRNSGLPILHGKLEDLGGRTRINVTMKLHGLVQAFLLVFCAIQLKSLLEKYGFDLFDVIFIVVVTIIICGGFWFEVRLSKKAFLELFKGDIITSDAPHQDC
ncbi:hypothetical protein [Geomonas anaerohicana]|uniref:Uncharacterized protein n=1 Tax=Geomonas anaerohicana TaxID=2798583 RepID=A0ABS0YGT9_9BACT|nr:hypothetical protein [Geomonas anaerohicana]MBJ6751501.1 hypothetical protein [Geomonas anaerohicana]